MYFLLVNALKLAKQIVHHHITYIHQPKWAIIVVIQYTRVELLHSTKKVLQIIRVLISLLLFKCILLAREKRHRVIILYLWMSTFFVVAQKLKKNTAALQNIGMCHKSTHLFMLTI